MASPAVPFITFSSTPLSKPSPSVFLTPHYNSHLKQFAKRAKFPALCAAQVATADGFPMNEFFANDGANTKGTGENKWDSAQYEALLKGGEQVTSVLEEMVKLLEDMNMDEASEEVAVQLAAQGVIGKRVDEMESGFMMALDYMIQLAVKDEDDKRKSLLEVIKETVLSHLTKKCPPHVQVIGLLCRTPQKESRHELLRRVAAGGGVFQSKDGTKVHLPGSNLNDIANQADDLLEVNFLTKLVALRPGKTVRDMIKNVMQGKDEGAESSESEDGIESGNVSGGIAGRASVTGRKPLPVRPGMFLETVSKVLGGIYEGNISGITAQHLEWVTLSLNHMEK
ncbi:hypothetical protein PHJA_001261800 [Phtheirospermum japonicum]|uniref:Protein PEP-RELATED DEVELOPMENT ARRESTED 1, chloroplastic n=1 Tax=Phtheirospermum japonicum TaxID=374723 RepID=A0A830C217_9LAMI|nr:hypothetical protein PHJA_001261800 [Phtheirospermum japonicum]